MQLSFEFISISFLFVLVHVPEQLHVGTVIINYFYYCHRVYNICVLCVLWTDQVNIVVLYVTIIICMPLICGYHDHDHTILIISEDVV